ncbi:MAG: histidine--tRNA ligase [Bacteroidota bacterium]
MSKTKPSLPRGTRDFGPKVSARRSFIIGKMRSNFLKYGFQEISTPSMENLSVLTGKYGAEGDQLLFKILNSGDFLSKTEDEDYQMGSTHLTHKIAEKGLRYDLTVPFARYVVMNQHSITFPFKRFQIQPVWRADRPQKGRYREFYQCDADIIGSDGKWNEIELTLLIRDVFKDLNLDGYVIKINHREVLFLLADYLGVKEKSIEFCAEIDKIDKIGPEKVAFNLNQIGADPVRVEQVLELFNEQETKKTLERLEGISAKNRGVDYLQSYLEQLKAIDPAIKIELDISLARGLSYYTGLIYEVKATQVSMGSISGGGRYDNLTGIFGLKGISGIGISFGLDRIYDVLEELDLFPEELEQSIQLLVVHFNEEQLIHGHKVVAQLRDAGIKSDLYPEAAKIRKQFDYADKIDAPYVLIIGDEEIASRNYSLKNMLTGEQNRMPLNEIINFLKGLRL